MKIPLRSPFVAIVAGVLSLFATTASAQAIPVPSTGAKAGFLFDASGGYVLWNHAGEKLLPPASLTKLVTALVVVESGDLEAQATITPEALRAEGTRLYAEEGWSFRMDELVWGMLLNSANDAAVAAAQATSPDGTMASFNTLMNDKARSLGATSSTFGNPTGLDSPETRSTARDMAMIAAAVLEDPFLSKIVSTRTHDISWGDGTKKALVNQNKLLGQFDGAIGVKMGYTDDAGRTMIAAARRGDTTLISVLLGVPEPTASSAKLLDWGFANLASLRSSSNERIDPSNLVQPSHGLEVVVIDGETPATTSGLPPLLAPLAAMIAAFVIYRLVRRWGEPPAGPPKHRVSPLRERVRV